MLKTTAELLRPFTPAPRACRECGTVFTPEFTFAALDHINNICEPCAWIQSEATSRREVERCNALRAASEKKDIRPPMFRDTEAHRLPHPHVLQRVMAWTFGPIGLTLHGETGGGKSRCAWMLAQREHLAGKRVWGLNSASGFDYAAQFHESPAVAKEWIDRMISADVLLLDDVFKVKLTESFECALFAVVTMRTEDGRPIIATTNDTGDTLIARMSADRGAPMIRRLRDYTKAIPFGK